MKGPGQRAAWSKVLLGCEPAHEAEAWGQEEGQENEEGRSTNKEAGTLVQEQVQWSDGEDMIWVLCGSWDSAWPIET